MKYVNSIKLNKSSLTLRVGETYEDMEATVSPSDATNKTLFWCSDNPSVASVNENSGRVFANGIGTTTIYACSTDGSCECDCCTVTVANIVPVEKVTIDMPDFVMQIGKSKKLTATVGPVNATNKSIIWRSSNENILKVVDGTVCALNVGTATITARSADNNSIEAYCNIRVTENVIVERVYISEDDIVLRPNGSTYLHECVLPENAANPKVVWSSSDTSVATVNPESGLVMAQGEGTAKIYATAADGGRAQTYIYVTVEPIIPVESVTVNPLELKLPVGESMCIAKKVEPENATDKRVIWCSSNPDVACVDCYSGRVTANKVGTATITVTTVDGGFVASCTVMVKNSVIIENDDNYSKVTFNDGKVWRCNDFYYDTSLERNLPFDSERAHQNDLIDFSIKQLGFLFRIDPNGVIYYVMNKYLGESASPTDYLLYRDNIFKEIYGKLPRYFTYENSQLEYYTGINKDNRYSVYSEAELLFGMLPRWTWQNVMETLWGAALEIISIYVPGVGLAMMTYEFITAFFFTGAIAGAVNSAASEFISDSLTENYGRKIARKFGWAIAIVGMIPSLLESALPPNVDEAQISIYENAYKNESYIIKVSNNNQTVDLNEFIEHYKSLI